MKNTYIRPESRLFIINLAENIADSIGTGSVSGSGIIRFTSDVDPCYKYYTDCDYATSKLPPGSSYDECAKELQGFKDEAYAVLNDIHLLFKLMGCG